MNLGGMGGGLMGAAGAGAATGGLGLIPMGISAGLGMQQLGRQKKALQLQKQNERLQEQAQLGQIQQQGQESQHEATQAQGNILGSMGDRGLGNSSIPQGALKENDYQNQMRLQALQRQQSLITNTQGNQESIWNIQRNMTTAQNQMKLLNGFLGGGASGGAQAMSQL